MRQVGKSRRKNNTFRSKSGAFDDTKTDLATLEEILIECAKAQGNITRIYEEKNGWDVDAESEIKMP